MGWLVLAFALGWAGGLLFAARCIVRSDRQERDFMRKLREMNGGNG